MARRCLVCDEPLVQLAGIPFGLFADMLGPARTHANAMRGLVFGMLTRAGWEGSMPMQNAALWQLWDEFDLGQSEMLGWCAFDPTCLV